MRYFFFSACYYPTPGSEKLSFNNFARASAVFPSMKMMESVVTSFYPEAIEITILSICELSADDWRALTEDNQLPHPIENPAVDRP